VGALRKLTIALPAMRVAFEEVIEHAEPPRRLVYRVVRGLPLRHHHGEITLTTEGAGTRLRWNGDFTSPVPAFELAAKRLVDRQLDKSLDVLASVVLGAPEVRVAPRAFADDLDELPELEHQAMRVLDEQRALADRLAAARDPKYWFTRVYQYVTE